MKAKKILSNKEFEEMLNHGVLVIHFNAPWGGPCYSQQPIIDAIADHYQGKIMVASANVASFEELAVNFGITKVPTLIIFKNGKEVYRLVGLQPESSLIAALEKVLS